MIPHKQGVNVKLHIILEALSNKQFSQWGRSSSRMPLTSLKKIQKIVVQKQFAYYPFHACDVVTCCCMLYNFILDGHDVDVHAPMLQLEQEDH
jgi:hypothetical protein